MDSPRLLTLDATSDPKILAGTGRLIYEAAPEFYSLMNVSMEQVVESISRQIGHKGGLHSHAVASLIADEVVGVYTGIPGDRLASAQVWSALALAQNLPSVQRTHFIQAAKGRIGKAANIPAESFYLSRISTAAAARNRGIAAALLDDCIAVAGSSGARSICVHFLRDNGAATSFYRKHGFEPAPSAEGPYCLAVRGIS